MFTKGGKTYADAYKYLRNVSKGYLALTTTEAAEDFQEESMALPLEVRVENGSVMYGGWFVLRPEKLDYTSIKTALIKARYTNDDQIAIVLNQDDSEEDSWLYEEMQRWRDFASEVAKKAMECMAGR